MQSRRPLEDARARLRRGHILQKRGGGGTGRPSAGFAISTIAGIAMLALSCGDGAVEPAPPPAPVATTVTVNPSSAVLNALAETARFAAEVRDQNGQVMAGAAVAWASTNASIASVDASGLVTAVANGSATITATSGSVSGSATVTVAQEVSAIEVVPDTATVVVGDTLRLAATATDANGQVVTEVTFAWVSGDTAVAVVDASGLVAGIGAGQARVTATAAGVAGHAALTVLAPAPTTVAVTPDTVALTALGQTAQLAAEAHDQVGRRMEGVRVSWSSADTTVASVDSAGLVTAAGGGATTVSATAGEASGEAVVTVMQSASSVVVTPASDTVTLGDTVRLAAEAFDENGHTVAGTEFNWSSSNVSTAGVDDSGLVTGNGEGLATITATAGNAHGTSEIAVENPDRAALVALYEATDGENWINSENWLTDASLGDWYGVRTDGSGRVVSLDLAGEWDSEQGEHLLHGLTGQIPVELANLDKLRTLNLRDNALEGSIPPELGSLANLESLQLGGNNLVGPIPSELANLAQLRSLYLYDNALEGSIPPELGSLANLVALQLDRNNLVGPIPSELANLAQLRSLYLYDNALEGSIPPELGSLDKLRTLNLRDNALEGSIPPELGSLANLVALQLDRNNLVGPIPSELANLAQLRSLYLYDNALEGSIPPELGSLANLESLQLGGNNLVGLIPSGLANLDKLRTLNLRDNALEGSIPPELGSLANLEWLQLGGNNLVGPIPSELANLAQLRHLNLGENKLEGSIPPELGSLANLEWLQLGGNNLVGPIPSELANLAQLRHLYLYGNALEGSIPPELGSLANLEWLNLVGNELEGPIPQSFLQLDRLRFFYLGRNADLCVPGTSAFVAWLEGIEQDGSLCNESDWTVLESLFELAGGSGWTHADGWVSGPALEKWHGVRADSLGQVVALDLEGNGLSGQLPLGLGSLARMTELRIGGNTALFGPLPLSLAALSLRALHYQGTDVCAPSQTGFREWLNSIPSHEGTGASCAPLSDREILGFVYETLRGSDWTDSDNWLTDRPLRDWHGVEVDGQGRVIGLSLTYNRISGWIPRELGSLKHLESLRVGGFSDLAGTIPPELGDLANLRTLSLFDTDLEGAIPPELGELANLRRLDLGGNNLEGEIPAQLGRLRNLTALFLDDNQLSGMVPPELGTLANLHRMSLSGNELTGPIPAQFGNLPHLRRLSLDRNRLVGSLPAELGNLGGLEELHVGHNSLHGTVPVEFRGLASLREFSLSGNADMSGALPAELTALDSLETLIADGTGLCAPSDPDFLNWLDGLPTGRIPLCGGSPAMAYLVQTVQSREFPVPLVAGEEALLRTFVTASRANRETSLPPVRASFHVGGARVHVAEMPASAGPIPTEVEQGSLAASVNAVIPADVIRPGLEMVIEIDPDGTLDPGLGVARRIPETGSLPIDVRDMPVLDLTVIPFLWSADPDSAILDHTAGMATDPLGHELLSETRTLLPVGGLDVTAHEPVLTSSNNMFDLHRETGAIRALEAGGGHWMGMMSGRITGAGGVASRPGRVSSSAPATSTIAHELGHNMNLSHAPCGGPGGPDPAFPYRDGSSGAWGYDINGGRLVNPSRPDLMSYCGPEWVSDYHFTKALHFRLADEGSRSPAMVAESAASLMLWGGVDADGEPFLDPVFAVDAPPMLPDSAGDYRIIGTSAGGETLFSISFTMPVLADADGESSFVFVVPAQTMWQTTLAEITLTGPAGTTAVNSESNRPMAILRDPRTGHVRGILRGPPPQYQVAADAAGDVAGPGLDMLFSRGIPDAAAWPR